MPKARVLIADGDEYLVATLSWLLKEQGYEACVAACGEGDALYESLEDLRPDLLLVDVMMPSINGSQFLERLKSHERWRDLPVLVISAAPPEDADRLLDLGAADFISKPFRVRDLMARIGLQLRLRDERQQARDELRSAEAQLLRARDEAESGRKLVDIVSEVTGALSPEEIGDVVVRRVARALNISRCSLILARPGDAVGTVTTAFENPALRNLEIRLDKYPEIQQALERGKPVLVEDVHTSPLYAGVREEWEAAGTAVPIQSVIALPFALDRRQTGVFFLRRTRGEPGLRREDVEFADTVIRAAVAAINKAQAIEMSRADKERLEMLASTDPLTQTLNRRALMERLVSEIERARRYALVLTLLMLDLDHFKAVNDTYGHLLGDRVLREVSRILQREARTVDVVARFGGEEFVVVLPETSEEGAIAFAERIRLRIAECGIQCDDRLDTVSLTVSIGVASFPSARVDSAEELIARADEALYRAKASGRNQVCT